MGPALLYGVAVAAGFLGVAVLVAVGWLWWLSKTAPEWPTDRCVDCGRPRNASKTPGQCAACRERLAVYDAAWTRIDGGQP